jgi:hypothetical protein
MEKTMNDKAGTMSSGLVWAFALGAVVLGVVGGYATAGLGAKVSSAVFFGCFLVGGFLGTFLTKAQTWLASIAFVLASIISAGVYYGVAAGAFESAGSEGAEAGMLGAFVGVFVAAITLVSTLVAGLGGCIAGGRAKKMMLGA